MTAADEEVRRRRDRRVKRLIDGDEHHGPRPQGRDSPDFTLAPDCPLSAVIFWTFPPLTATIAEILAARAQILHFCASK